MSIEIQKTIFEGDGKAEIFNFRPENIEKEKRGNLFILGKIAKKLPRNDQQYYLLNSLAAIVKKEYYSSPSIQPSEALDEALKKANILLSEVPQEIANSMDLVILILIGEQVNFSSIGTPEILLLREERIFRLHKNTRSSKNFSDAANENSRGKHPRKILFYHVTKGRIKTEDRIIIASSGLTKWLENTHFKVRLAKRPWEGIKEYLRQKRVEAKDQSTLPLIQISLDGSLFSHSVDEKPIEGETSAQPLPNTSSLSQLRLPILTQGEPLLPRLLPHGSFIRWRHKENFLLGDTSVNGVKKAWRALIIILQSILNVFLRRTLSRKYIFYAGAFIIIIAGGSMLFKHKSALPSRTNPPSPAQVQEGVFTSFSYTGKNSAATFTPSYGHFFGSDIFAIRHNQLYQINPNSNTVEPLLPLEGEIKGMTSSKDALIILIKKAPEEMEVVFFNPSERSMKREFLSWPLKTYSIKGIRESNGNLYILEALRKQIVKYDIHDFSRPTLWLPEKTKNQLQNPLAFALERSIYLLQNNPPSLTELRIGTIKRHIAFDGKANGVYTSAELKNLYLFDSEGRRILIIQKETGKPLKIIKDSRFTAVLDIEVDEARNLLKIISPEGLITFTQALP